MIKRVVIIAVTALAAVSLLLVCALQGERMRRAVLRMAGVGVVDPEAPLLSRVDNITGFFPFWFTLHDLVLVTADGDHVHLPEVRATWGPLGLLRGEIHITSMDVPRATVKPRMEQPRTMRSIPPWPAGIGTRIDAAHLFDVHIPGVGTGSAVISARSGGVLDVRIDAALPNVTARVHASGAAETEQLHINISAETPLGALHIDAYTHWANYLWLLLHPLCDAPEADLLEAAMHAEGAWGSASAAARVDSARTASVRGHGSGAAWTLNVEAALPHNATLRVSGAADGTVEFADGRGSADIRFSSALRFAGLDLSAASVHARFTAADRIDVTDVGLLVGTERLLGGHFTVSADGIEGRLEGALDALRTAVVVTHNRTHQSVAATADAPHVAYGAFSASDLHIAARGAAGPGVSGSVRVTAGELRWGGVSARSVRLETPVTDGRNDFAAEVHGRYLDTLMRGAWTWSSLSIPRTPFRVCDSDGTLEGRASSDGRTVSAVASLDTRYARASAEAAWPLDDGGAFTLTASAYAELQRLCLDADGTVEGSVYVAGARNRAVDVVRGSLEARDVRIATLSDASVTARSIGGPWDVAGSARIDGQHATFSGHVQPQLVPRHPLLEALPFSGQVEYAGGFRVRANTSGVIECPCISA